MIDLTSMDLLYKIEKPGPSQKCQHFLLAGQIQNGHRRHSLEKFMSEPEHLESSIKYTFSTKSTTRIPILTSLLRFNIILTQISNMAAIRWSAKHKFF